MAELQALQVQVLAVSFTPPRRVTAFLAGHPLPFPAVSDPERKAYQAFTLEKTSWGKMLRPSVGIRFIKLLMRGWIPEKPERGEDLLQLGGDFVLDQGGRLVFAYRSEDPTDNPSMATLLQAVKQAAAMPQPTS